MGAAPDTRRPDTRETTDRVASGRPVGAGISGYGDLAPPLLENGYEPLPIIPREKRPALSRWTSCPVDSDAVETWSRQFPGHSVGLRTGALVGLDIDVLDPDRAHEVQALAEHRFGATLIRVGLWPKRLLLYRTVVPFGKLKAGQVEFLGAGQQFVAFGTHPGTGQPYYWPEGETPLDVPLSDLPTLDAASAGSFLAELGGGLTKPVSIRRGTCRPEDRGTGQIERNAQGLVTDGRDSWLSSIAFHAVHDALAMGATLDACSLAAGVWNWFCSTADLDRPRKAGGRDYGLADALTKVTDKLRLLSEGRLPSRDTATPEPDHELPTLNADEGRTRLRELLESFAAQVRDWHAGDQFDVPALGIRATVGLGKSHMSRTVLLKLQQDLRAAGQPHRLFVFVPSHALAEEAAAEWTAAGAATAVLRGYGRKHPVSGEPMCRDLDMVKMAIAARLPVHETACSSAAGRCRLFEACEKQQNRREVAAADVVVAPYDTLFSGLSFEKDDVALLVIDEACWPRAIEQQNDLTIDAILAEPVSGLGRGGIERSGVAATADLVAYRERLTTALKANGAGPLKRSALLAGRLTADDARHAARLERARVDAPSLHPGMTIAERRKAMDVTGDTERAEQLAGLWTAVARFLEAGSALSGAIRLGTAATGFDQCIEVRQVRSLHESLRGRPVLHLDATLRPDLARLVLPGLQVEEIEVAAPHMRVRQVVGSFGKSMLCQAPGLTPEEAKRRENRLGECVDYVRWQAAIHRNERVLVVTYKAVEQAFQGIPGVETAHFNAVAGLDAFKDVRQLIVIGRPMPGTNDLEAMVGACFDHVGRGSYEKLRAGLRSQSGQPVSMPVLRHTDERAELLRRAICDDELVQVVGRGRGVNRTADDPLDVHILADVALSLVYDEITVWEAVKPDLFQRMLLAGLAVDSPGDAAVLHTTLFTSSNQAKQAFEAALFKCQTPMYDSYREMTLKSAAYRRAGRGRGWQCAWWIGDDLGATMRARIERALGHVAGWGEE
ncbi:hypothetical protein FHY55_12910 [Oceanicola sp. D3]|uniref:bifunctional DNA primase/polymerase n=1 Tax=Oceanicola sp. D3 TaxID=2587163 RepID=UPI00111E7AAB|nr:bifunctional DNA primase/polymerase [Oceanicola sp. D3]QDC10092.1 hypothetical protein FHY55_12910 [Oceanicola sp. D3]